MFGDDKILLIKNQQVYRQKINTFKSTAFLYTNNETSGKETKKMIPFTIALKPIKYLGINLDKEVRDLYIENCKNLMKNIKEYTRSWRLPCVHELNKLIFFISPRESQKAVEKDDGFRSRNIKVVFMLL